MRRPRSGCARPWAVALLAVLLLGACVEEGDGPPDPLGVERSQPNRASLPTLPGGVDLTEVDPTAVLVGDGLWYGTPLPSEQVAADGFTTQPEVTSVVVRRVYREKSPRLVGTVVVLGLDGRELFDEAALAAFEASLVGSLAQADPEDFRIGPDIVHRAEGDRVTAMGFRHGDRLVVMRGTDAALLEDAVGRQRRAIAAGATGSLEQTTPLPQNPPETALVEVPTVTFAPIPPPEEEPIQPVPPALPGATTVEGRYGVTAGERRTTVWVITVDPAAYPTAEALDAALPDLVSSRADGQVATPTEVIDRVVLTVAAADGEPQAAVFRHGGLVVLVEGTRAAPIQSVVTDWIAVLSEQRL